MKHSEDWIYIETAEQQKRIASPAYIKELLGIPKYVKTFTDYIHQLQNRVATLEEPIRRQKIVELLENEDRPRTFGYLQRRLSPRILPHDVWHLEREGKLKMVKHGHAVMWCLNNGGAT